MSKPSEAQRKLNRKRASAARQAVVEGASTRSTTWAKAPIFDHLIVGGGLAATLDWATLAPHPGACGALSERSDPWWVRGQWRMGQPVRELVCEGFVLQPHDFTADVGGFAPAQGLSYAIALTASDHGFPVVFGHIVRDPIVDGQPLEVKVGPRRFRAERIDVAVGPGPARRLRDRNGEPTILSEEDEQALLGTGRLVFGQDQWKSPVLGPRVLVYGGGATAAWNVEFAKRVSDQVHWYARRGGVPDLYETKVAQIEQRLVRRSASLDPARAEWLRRTRERILAFRSADLPRNREVFRSAGVHWAMRELQQVRNVGDEIEVVSTSERGTETQRFDQLVISIGQASEAPEASASIMSTIRVTWLEHDGHRVAPADRRRSPRGRVVGACEDAADPRVRCLGAPLRSRVWWSRLTRRLMSGVKIDLQRQLVDQAAAAPPHSRGIEGAVFQVAANVVLANSRPLDVELGEQRFELLARTLQPR